MSRAPLTADGRAATTQIALAAMLGVNRDTLRLWRQDGAPDTLELDAWRRWLMSTGRSKLAAGLPGPAVPDPPAAPPATPPEEDAPAGGGVGVDWEERGKRAKALLAERQLAESEGCLIPRQLVVRVATTLGAAVATRLTTGIIEPLLAALLDATPQQRARVRDAHDRAILALRAELAALPRETLAHLLPPAPGAAC